jgi:hypothetical protein
MFLERAAKVQNGVAFGIKTRQQLITYNQDFRLTWALETINNRLIIRILVAIAIHHLCPEF